MRDAQAGALLEPWGYGLQFRLDGKLISLAETYYFIQRSGYVYTNNLKLANKASEKLETGCVAVNTPVVAVAEAPFGGIKQTGYGREGGSMAIKDYLNVKYTHLGLKG